VDDCEVLDRRAINGPLLTAILGKAEVDTLHTHQILCV
jgi:hypothetical protein